MKILNDNGTHHIFENIIIQDKLEPINYVFDYDAKSGQCFLKLGKGFSFPDKIYEDKDSNRLINAVVSTFEKDKENLGVLLTGNKGQGKSLTLSRMCKEIQDKFKIPIIEINKKILLGVDFIAFLKSIKQDYILLIDEFEKNFDKQPQSEPRFHDQTIFLSFMSGVLSSENKILFVFSSNSDVNDFMINRPRRIKFRLEYNELSKELFDSIVDDRLENKEFKDDLQSNVFLGNLNIDALISIIDSINLFKEPYSSFKNIINYQSERFVYEVYSVTNGKRKFIKLWTSTSKLCAEQYYLAGMRVDRMIKFTNEEIIFIPNPDDFKETRESVKKDSDEEIGFKKGERDVTNKKSSEIHLIKTSPYALQSLTN